MPNNVSTVKFTDYNAEQQEIERRRKMADALLARGLEPDQGTQFAGGVAVRKSPLEGLSKVFSAYAGASQQQDLTDKQKSLAEALRGERQNTIQDATTALSGREAQAPVTPFDDDGNAMPGVAGVKADPRQAYQILANSNDPSLQQLGLAQLLKTPEIKAYKAGDVLYQGGQQVGAIPQAKTPFTLSPGGVRFDEQGNRIAELPPTPDKNEGAWGEPYQIGGATVQKNDRTGEIRTAVSRPPVTNIINKGEQKVYENETSARKEFNDLPEVKSYKAVIPVINSAKKAPDTPAGDLDLIYAVGKVLDPNSVVREGEMSLVIKSGSPLQRFQGAVNYITSGRGRLPPAQREELVKMLNQRVGAIEEGYNAARSTYEPMVVRSGLNPKNVFTDLPSTSERRETPRADGKRVVVDY